jgi:methionine-rich copper-binding protein CopC
MSAQRARARAIRGLAAFAVFAALTGLGAAPASAHSQLTSTSPVDGAVLDVPPSEVRLTFDSPLLQDTDTISINDEYGNVIKSIHPAIEGNSVAIPWPAEARPGTYQVAYRVVCGDGHPVVGALTLTVNASAAASTAATAAAVAASASAAPFVASPVPSPAAVAADAAGGTSASMVPLLIGVAVLLAGAVALVAAIMTRRRSTPVPPTP